MQPLIGLPVILPAYCKHSNSSIYNKSVTIRLVATCYLQFCCNLVKQLTTNLWIKSFDNQLAESLLTASNKRVVNKLLQAMRRQYQRVDTTKRDR